MTSWLPTLLSFLSGLPEPARRRRVIVPIQVFVDDSGMSDGRSRHLVLAAVISSAEQWAQFSDEWELCLRQTPALKHFKMRDAAGISGEFFGRSAPERDAKLTALTRIINRYVPIFTFTVIDLAAHAQTLAKHVRRRHFNEPYFWAFQSIILQTARTLWGAGLRERFEIIFDEQVMFGLHAKVWYPAVRHVTDLYHPEVHDILPVDPIFRTDIEFLPIQAADLFAWNVRHTADNDGTNPFEWTWREMPNVRKSIFAEKYDLTNMAKMLEDREKMWARPWTQEEQEAFKRFTEDSKHLPPLDAKKPRKKPRRR